jgi:hypothetical protein
MMAMVRDMSKCGVVALALSCALTGLAKAQLLGEPPIPPKNSKKMKRPKSDVEWLWQYSPPPVEGREHDLIQDPHFLPFLQQNFTAPQSFWGLQAEGQRIPGKVIADQNRYITATGSVFHFRSSRGLLFVDLNDPQALAVFAAIDWIRDSKTTDQPDAEYTLWIFPNRVLGTELAPHSLPPPLQRSLIRWMADPLPGSGIVEKVTAAILVDPDGTPHQIPVPKDLGN